MATAQDNTLLVHPGSNLDFKRDPQTTRRDISLSRARKYSLLESPPVPTAEFRELVGGNESPQDEVDNSLLYTVYRDAVNALVTEDTGIHKKAKRLGLGNRVYFVEQAVQWLKSLTHQPAIPPPEVHEDPVYVLDERDPIFDSLRADYVAFDDWLAKIKQEGRRCLYVKRNGALAAVCIWKPTGDGIKISTFKVDAEYRGQRLGELLLKSIFEECLNRGSSDVYVTLFPKQVHLAAFLEEFGFVQTGSRRGELVYQKSFPQRLFLDGPPDLSQHAREWPAFHPQASWVFVPIKPRWHDRLFPDNRLQIAMDISTESVAGNAIRKAYIARSNPGPLRPGDLLLFYRSRDVKSITTLGIVEAVLPTTDADAMAAFVGKRTVYTMSNIEASCEPPGGRAILFRQIRHLASPITDARIKDSGLLSRIPIGMRRVNQSIAMSLMKDEGDRWIS